MTADIKFSFLCSMSDLLSFRQANPAFWIEQMYRPAGSNGHLFSCRVREIQDGLLHLNAPTLVIRPSEGVPPGRVRVIMRGPESAYCKVSFYDLKIAEFEIWKAEPEPRRVRV